MMEQMEEMALVQVLLSLDIATLLVCTCVCKSWRALVRSPWFQNQWLATHEKDQDPLVLVTVSHHIKYPPHPIYVSKWSFASPHLSPPLNIHIPGVSKPFEILASSSGLVLACLANLHKRWYSKLSLAVGNPVTDEWIMLPSPIPTAIAIPAGKVVFDPDYQLLVDATTGNFTVTVTELSCLNRDIRACYDSKLGSWSRIPLPAAAANNRQGTGMVSLFDVDGKKEWVKFQVPELENKRIDGATLWNYRANTYIAGIVRLSDTLEPTHYGLWKVVGKDRVSKVFMVDMYKEVDKNGLRWGIDDIMELTPVCRGDGKLLCIAAWECSKYWPPSVYDLSTGAWFHFHAKPAYAEGGVHLRYSRAAVYRPSLLKPVCTTRQVTACPPANDLDKKRNRSNEDVLSCFMKRYRGIRYLEPEANTSLKWRKCSFCNYTYALTADKEEETGFGFRI